MRKQAIVLFTHFWDESIDLKLKAIKSTLNSELYDLYLSMNTEDENVINKIPEDVDYVVFSVGDFKNTEYTPICSRMLPGSCHYPMLKFWQDHPNYSHYWFIEYDVDFSGDWSYLFDSLNYDVKIFSYESKYESQVIEDYDFISCYVEDYGENNNEHWGWWRDGNGLGWPVEELVRGFNPICRYSNRALLYIHNFSKLGFSGHSEILITTCLAKSNHKIADFSNQGTYGIKTLKESFYTSEKDGYATVKYRPIMKYRDYHLENKIYHPVKITINS